MLAHILAIRITRYISRNLSFIKKKKKNSDSKQYTYG